MSARRALVGGVVLLAILAFVAIMTTTLITVAIWPGEAKLTAPLFCPGDKPDAFVVVDTYSAQPGETTYNYSLYCMGPRGDTAEIGFFRPSAVLTVGHAALIAALVVVALIRVRRHQRAVGALGALGAPSIEPGPGPLGTGN